MPTRSTILFVGALTAVSLFLLTAHLHPGTEFTLPLFPQPDAQDGYFQAAWPALTEAENRHLTQQQCRDTYPDLYLEADRAHDWYKAKGGITRSMVDQAEKEANARLVIHQNQLFVKVYKGGINTRTQAVIAGVYAGILTSPEPLPDVEFVVQTSDAGAGKSPIFALCRTASQKALWLMPDFGFFSWPEPGVGSYSEVRAKTLAYEQSLGLEVDSGMEVIKGDWENKTDKLFWRGSPMVEVRHDLLRAAQNQPWSDVKELNWGAINGDEKERLKNNGDIKSPAEHCQYRFLAHVEGWAYSGRLKYLQQCRSVIVGHKLQYIQHYHHLLNAQDNHPEQNYIEVPLPFEKNLGGVMEGLMGEGVREKVERIAENGWKGMRQGYISPAANDCYFRYLLHRYAEVQAFRPSIEGAAPYESFVLMGKTHWDPHRR
ncbi:hypothetical protein L198_08024 [Cryptococcus wingfieldii CBS 7118]|uniref:Glycosyl transferase CAP10 domain-containing protein n=1 Tax=Cryptococcus wingfieldii CBS 7118 TaxID=1295528 RepID=A0A1E3HLR5_9TREE|nr:hypothetical protein L198_08024 [Cryptococcus wingfieldii CBS 7118]ODN77289.1 hypothetical protein L198_08024 [Cryptococcus wingfieldii CBS 7118]